MVRMRSRVQAPIVAPFLFQEIMKKVAKVLLKNPEGKYLVLYRNHHPLLGSGMDIPGGTVKRNEAAEDGAIREVREESGIHLDMKTLQFLRSSTEYSTRHSEYSLYGVDLQETPEVVLSWEHRGFTWLTADEIISKSAGTKDEFLRMTVDTLQLQQTS